MELDEEELAEHCRMTQPQRPSGSCSQSGPASDPSGQRQLAMSGAGMGQSVREQALIDDEDDEEDEVLELDEELSEEL